MMKRNGYIVYRRDSFVQEFEDLNVIKEFPIKNVAFKDNVFSIEYKIKNQKYKSAISIVFDFDAIKIELISITLYLNIEDHSFDNRTFEKERMEFEALQFVKKYKNSVVDLFIKNKAKILSVILEEDFKGFRYVYD